MTESGRRGRDVGGEGEMHRWIQWQRHGEMDKEICTEIQEMELKTCIDIIRGN